MFILINGSYINTDHIAHISPTDNVRTITLTTGKVFNVPVSEFDRDILPLLPMAEKLPVMTAKLPVAMKSKNG